VQYNLVRTAQMFNIRQRVQHFHIKSTNLEIANTIMENKWIS
jgi:hypothetical protein